MPTLKHPQGEVTLSSGKKGTAHVTIKSSTPGLFIRATSCDTQYPQKLIEAILQLKGVAYVCDEIQRDEDPTYIEKHLVTTLFSFVAPKDFVGKRMLDFGCGCGASTMIFARHLPKTTIVGIDLEESHLEIARLRAAHYGATNIQFLCSPSGDTLPPNLGTFDYIFLPAVYEHLLPNERIELTARLWNVLKPGGILLIDETPHRWFPLEGHTTGLPLMNYLPDGLAGWFARHVSPRNLQHDSWQTLLRKGIRGSSAKEILQNINRVNGKARLLPPLKSHIDPIDIWYEGYVQHARQRAGRSKQIMRLLLKAFKAVTGIALVPYISLAIKKI